ncbi:hypothetical protein OPV22_014061 [Ensete ventricosum]|uniref:Uncharacterized protein n=1 Tax=Ensete ventricosum TaxID=4639 RepID=A0AAV8R9R4_ENSVE|nr:hypothetical protein OPV22_014061 [Ensete ventricosum]
MREGEQGKTLTEEATVQRWRAEAEVQKSQPRARRPCRICAVEATGGDEARAAAGAGEGCDSDRWKMELYLTVLGTGGLKSSVSGFGSDQFDETNEVLRNCEPMQLLQLSVYRSQDRLPRLTNLSCWRQKGD